MSCNRQVWTGNQVKHGKGAQAVQTETSGNIHRLTITDPVMWLSTSYPPQSPCTDRVATATRAADHFILYQELGGQQQVTPRRKLIPWSVSAEAVTGDLPHYSVRGPILSCQQPTLFSLYNVKKNFSSCHSKPKKEAWRREKEEDTEIETGTSKRRREQRARESIRGGEHQRQGSQNPRTGIRKTRTIQEQRFSTK